MATGRTETADATESNDDAVAGRVNVLCHPCGRRQKTTTATSECLTCQEHLCDECIELHRVFKPGEHHITAITYQNTFRTPVDMKGMDTCVEHCRMFRYLCKDHDALCCELCHIKMHKKCDNIFDIDDLQTNNVENIDVEQNLDSTLKQANEIIEQSDAKVKAIKIKIETVSKDMNSMKDKIEKVEKRAGVAKSVKTELSDVIALNNDVQARGTDMQRFIVGYISSRSHITLLSKLKDFVNDDVDNTISLKQEGTQTAEVETRDVACETEEATETEDTTEVSLAQGGGTEQAYASYIAKENIQETQASKSDLVKPVHVANTIIKLQELPTHKLRRIRGDKKWPYITSLDFLTDGRIVAIDNYNFKCLILGPKLQRLGYFEFDCNAYGVTCIGNDQFAVTLNEPSIVLLSTDKSNNIMLTKTIRLPPNMNVDSIAPFYNGSFVLSTFDHNKPVRIVDVNGNYTFFNGTAFPKTQYNIDKCQCTFIASQNILAFTDFDENLVCLFNTQTGETVKVTDPQVNQPRGVGKGPNDSILVCCSASIVQLTTRGEVLASVDVGMSYLEAISVSNDFTHLAVSSTEDKNCQLRLFKIMK